jgi:flavin-dependent dehydrogenase
VKRLDAQPVSILGGGPAGAAAALSALAEGSPVSIVEKSQFPRHKVCGEFFSPEIGVELERLGVWDAFLAAGPARVRRMALHFGTREKICPLPEPAWGLSRYAFDALLLDCALRSGATRLQSPENPPQVIATGRNSFESVGKRGRRPFGFKAHFEGPGDDAVELYFFDGCYVGINLVEDGRTNVCGLGPEDYLKRFNFEYDAVMRRCPPLAERLRPLTRSMKWLSTGPLDYRQMLEGKRSGTGLSQYLAGDALSFVDPFTGSGLLAAVKTGALAGSAAARKRPVERYLADCRESLRKPFAAASLFRAVVNQGWADRLAGLVPGRVLFALTRPR